MKFKCQVNPKHLIELIGDRNFSLKFDSDLDKNEAIIDDDWGVCISISSGYGRDYNYEAASALIALLNQEYEEV